MNCVFSHVRGLVCKKGENDFANINRNIKKKYFRLQIPFQLKSETQENIPRIVNAPEGQCSKQRFMIEDPDVIII